MRRGATAFLGLCLWVGCQPNAPRETHEGSGPAPVVEVPEAGPRERPDLGITVSEPEDPASPVTFPRVPGRVSGFFETVGDVDRIRVDPRQLAAIGAAQIEVSPVPGVRPRLRVLGPGGIELLKIEAERAGEGAGIPNVGLPDQVEVWLEVGAMDGATSEFPYTVSIHRPERPYEGALEREPNDALELAQALVPGEVIAGFLHRAEDVDHFRLALSVPASVSIQLTPDAATDAVLDWLPMGAGGLDLGGEGEPESICAWGVGAGEHAVGVTRSHAGPSLPRYVLRARVEAEPVEREPNDLADGAALQELVDGMRGYIGTGGDVDAYRLRLFGAIDGQTSQLIRVEPGSGVDVAVEVTDADGASVTPRADAGGPGAREEVTVPLATGLRVVISEGQRGGHGCETAYVVRLPR